MIIGLTSTPMTKASRNGDLGCVKRLSETGYPCNRGDSDGWLPIHHAAERGYVNIVRYLIKRSSEIDRQTTINKYTPLMLAAKEGRTECVKVLLDAGADFTIKDDNGWTPYEWGKSENRIEISNYLGKLENAVTLLDRIHQS